MRPEVDEILDAHSGVASRATLLTAVSTGALDDEIRRRKLACLFPRAYCRPWDADLPEIRHRAALVSVGEPAALSHTTALRRWDLPCPPTDDIHVTVAWTRNPRPATPGLIIHHVKRPYPTVHLVHGLVTVDAAAAVTASWPLLRGPDQRAPMLAAARRNLVTAADVRKELARSTRLRGRRDLLELAGLVEAGCESELEIWGYLGVFGISGLRHGVRQLRLRARGRRYRVDLAYEQERVAVELDGRRYHSSTEQWERDIARDLALATIGWQTVRLSHSRLTRDVDGCRRDVLKVLAGRRQIREIG